jgi:hypothetical protein
MDSEILLTEMTASPCHPDTSDADGDTCSRPPWHLRMWRHVTVHASMSAATLLICLTLFVGSMFVMSYLLSVTARVNAFIDGVDPVIQDLQVLTAYSSKLMNHADAWFDVLYQCLCVDSNLLPPSACAALRSSSSIKNIT